ncbi:MAG: hypothetical protein ABL921_14570 [Pirellula sp.]
MFRSIPRGSSPAKPLTDLWFRLKWTAIELNRRRYVEGAILSRLGLKLQIDN